MGVARKSFDEASCVACGLCATACPSPESLGIDDGTLVCREALCLGCGKCARVCPTGAMALRATGYALFVGGKMGKFPRLGESLAVTIEDDDKLLDAVETVIDWYQPTGDQKSDLETRCKGLALKD